MIELEATHVTNHLTENLLVCELYPGVLVIDTFSGPFTVTSFGSRVEALPAGQDRRFPVRESTAELAAQMYEDQRAQAEVFGDSWPPPTWRVH